MLEDLEQYLRATTSAELCDLVLDSCNTLTIAGLDTHLFLLRNTLDSYEEYDTDPISECVHATLEPLFVNTLKEFGVQVSEDADLKVLNSILKGIQTIDNWDDPDTLNALTDSTEGNECALADILQIVSDLTMAEYLQVLVRVSSDLIVRIAEITNKNVIEPQPDEILVAAAQTRLRELLPKANFDDHSIFIKAIDNGMRLGLSFEATIGPYLNDLHQLPVEKLASELVAFAYASALQIDSVLSVLNRLKESFSFSTTDLLQLDAEIHRLL